MAPNTPAPGVTPPFSAAALALILDAEGVDQPGRWPGGASGITIGYGYDLSAETADELRADWSAHLHPTTIARLARTVGKSGQAARALAVALADINITREAAREVFGRATLPKYRQLTRLVYPALHQLPLDAQGALVSLVFNRGGSMGEPGKASWKSREEMRDIRRVLADGVQRSDLGLIATQLREMKRLWEGQGLGGLITRRENEALLVEHSGS